MYSRFCKLALILSTIAQFSVAQTPGYKSEFGFRTENDAYLTVGQDRYYTNGLFITFRHAANQQRLTENINKRIWEIEAGQKIYNPISGQINDLAKVDRPFAGYLYAGGTIHWLFQSENSLKLNAQLGTIGPSSLAEDGQVLLHDVIGFYEIRGWESQVRDEIGLNLSAEYNRFLTRSASKKTDLSFSSALRLGNTFSGAGVGLLFRAGTLKQFFNSASSSARISNNAEENDASEKEIFFYARPGLDYVLYDATTQGGLFSDRKGPITFDTKSLVFSQQLGLMYAVNRWTIDFSLLFKSREIKSSAKAHQYGSAAFYYRFN